MSKFYVQSGTLQTVVEAVSSRKAALWAVHQAMQQVLPVEDSDCQTPDRKSETLGESGVRVLGHDLIVSRHGFGATDRCVVSTMEVVDEWNQMVATLDRLQRMLETTGTAA
jgi:hypothetical protein